MTKQILLFATACAIILPLAAQNAAPTTPPEDTVKMEKFEVTDVPLEQQILPTSRPFNSVFGTDDNIVDVPRNVTIISRQQLSDISISSVLDFSKLTSSSYTTTNFGAPSNPSIRGQTADVYLNGVRARTTSNGNGLPLDFNSVESVNIVKGPGTAVQGTSMYVGGFVDLISKRPYFDGFKGSISGTVGSYGHKEWNIDVGGPLSKEVAYRVSYSGTDSGGYWDDYYNKNNSIYGALTFRPTDKYELFVNATAAFFRYTENWGFNRVTQALIDNNLYITGTNVNGGTSASAADPQNSKNVAGTTVFQNTIAWGPAVKVSRHMRLLKPGNHSTGREFNAQAIQTFKVGDDFKVVNNSYASYTARNTLSTYYYSEIIDPSWFLENRTEFIFSKKAYSLNTGLDLRYQRTKAYDDYSFEPANVWDLTKDHNFINVYNSVSFPAPNFFDFGSELPVPGWPGRFATPGTANGDTNDSHGTTVGPFAQLTWKAAEKFNVVAGVRDDYFKAHVREPLKPSHLTQDISLWEPNYNASLIYKMTPASSAYVTYNYSENISGAVGNGGGITGWDGATGTFLDKENFKQPAELYEAGTKYSLMQNKVFLNFAVYSQKRTAKSTSSTTIQEFKTKGFEMEVNYQPNKFLYATFSYTYVDAKSGAPFQYGLFGGASELIGGEAVVRTGTITRVSGLPRSQFNALVSYTLSNGLGLSANTLVTSPINNNVAGTLVIPWQYDVDIAATYKYKKWDFRLSVSNVTNEENWAPPNSVYGNGSILSLPGTQGQFSIKYSF